MSRLEKFINGNRDEFDDMAPPEKSWQRVEASLLKKTGGRVVPVVVFKWCAAAAVVIAVATIAFLMMGKKNPGKIAGAVKTDTASAGFVTNDTEQAPEVNQFARLIAGKQEELKSLAKEQPALYQQFAKDITQLDSSYNTLKNKLNITPNREILMEAMIQNLELQLDVLNQQLRIVRQIKQSKNYHHEKIEPTI